MRKSERLFDAITGIRDDLIEEAADGVPKRVIPWGTYYRYGALAACFLFVCGLGSLGLRGCGASGGMPMNSAAGGTDYGGSAQDGTAEASPGENGFIFFSYFSSNTGSILPLSFAEQTDNVTASRTLTLDLAASETPGNALVTDAYTLVNSTNTDLPVTLTYPVEYGSLENPPSLWISDPVTDPDFRMEGHTLWLYEKITIPAQSHVNAVFTYWKTGSSDAPGNEAIADRYFGFALEPMRSNLYFSGQTVRLTAPDGLHIVNQDFGFDPDAGVFSAELDLSIQKYTLDVLYPPS